MWLLALTVLAWVLVWLYLRFADRRRRRRRHRPSWRSAAAFPVRRTVSDEHRPRRLHARPRPARQPRDRHVPLGFIACIAGSLLFGRDEVAEATFDEVRVRSTTGIGSHVVKPRPARSPAGSAAS